MMPINFTLTYEHKTNDVLDDTGDVAAVPVSGEVLVTAQFPPGASAIGDGGGWTIKTFTGYMDEGVLKSKRGGSVGMRIWANDPAAFTLARLPYKVQFDVYDPLGRKIDINPTTFDAPSLDVMTDLGDFMPVPGAVAVAVPRVVTYLDNDDGTITFYVNGIAAGPPVVMTGGGGGAVSSVAGKTGAVTLVKTDVGLGNVDNTSDANKPVSTAQAAAISAAVNALVNGAPGALDQLNELAAALGNDANFAATITNSLALKAPLASPAFTGTPTGITKAHVGLGNVDNTSDVNKPVSTAQAAADALRQPLASVQLYGSGVPSSGLGKDTDTYTDYTNQKKYTKTAGAWAVTTDGTVSKEIAVAGTWSTAAGTLSDDTSDGMTSKKIVTTTSGNHLVLYTFTNPVSVANKMLRVPIRIDALSDWTGTIGVDISDTVGFTGRVTMMIVSSDTIRGGEVEAFTWAPNAGFFSGTPDLTAIKYLRINWTPTGGVTRNAYMGQPVLIG